MATTAIRTITLNIQAESSEICFQKRIVKLHHRLLSLR